MEFRKIKKKKKRWNKLGSEWTVSRLVKWVLIVFVVVLIIIGFVFFSYTPLKEKLGGMWDYAATFLPWGGDSGGGGGGSGGGDEYEERVEIKGVGWGTLKINKDGRCMFWYEGTLKVPSVIAGSGFSLDKKRELIIWDAGAWRQSQNLLIDDSKIDEWREAYRVLRGVMDELLPTDWEDDASFDRAIEATVSYTPTVRFKVNEWGDTIIKWEDGVWYKDDKKKDWTDEKALRTISAYSHEITSNDKVSYYSYGTYVTIPGMEEEGVVRSNDDFNTFKKFFEGLKEEQLDIKKKREGAANEFKDKISSKRVTFKGEEKALGYSKLDSSKHILYFDLNDKQYGYTHGQLHEYSGGWKPVSAWMGVSDEELGDLKKIKKIYDFLEKECNKRR